MITITDTAAKKVLEIIAEDPKLEDAGFRLGIQGAGCAGFQYMFGMDSDISEEDTVFESKGVKIIVDPVSYSYVMGSIVDFKKESMGEAFTIENPNAKTNCGCGHSFSV